MRVDNERSTLTGRVHRDNLDAYLELFTDAFLQPGVRRGRLRARAQRRDQRHREHAALLLRRGARQGGAARGSCSAARPTRTRATARSRACARSRSTTCARSTGSTTRARQRRARPGRRRSTQALVDARCKPRCAQLPAGRAHGAAGDRRRRRSQGRSVAVHRQAGRGRLDQLRLPDRRAPRRARLLRAVDRELVARRAPQPVEPPVPGDPRARGLELRRLLVHRGVSRRRRAHACRPSTCRAARQLFEVWIRTLPNAQAPFALRAALRELELLVDERPDARSSSSSRARS